MVFGETVQGLLARFTEGTRIYKAGRSEALRKARYTDLEMDCIRESRTAESAAIRFACKRSEIALKTGQNYFSIFSASKKHPRS
jgi:hypothetical protein